MKTISMVELRSHSERVIRDLRRGVRMTLSYRGQAVAELVPTAAAGEKLSPLLALERAQASSAGQSVAGAKAYLRELRADQSKWSTRAGR
jgi:antitoxin (DNA-binding transcriptional repressor) of toxin-antitoxin stability system